MVLEIDGSSIYLLKSFTNKIVEFSVFCSLIQLRAPIGLLANLPSSLRTPFNPLTQSQITNLLIKSC